jgi:membrane associated rhomboid family serine protease
VDDILVYIRYMPVASAIFALTLGLSFLAFSSDEFYDKMMLHPYRVSKGHDAYTLFTSGFIHKDLMHLFFNMFTFYAFAFHLELMIGHWQFALLYIVSLILSDLPTVYKHREDYYYRSLGASGAISALLFSFIMFNPLSTIEIMFLPIPIYAVIFGVLYLVYCAYASRRASDGINHDAHFYGALCGVIITVILNPASVQVFFDKISHALPGH